MFAQGGSKFSYSFFGEAFRERNIKKGDMSNIIQRDSCFPFLFFKLETIFQGSASGKIPVLHRLQFLFISFAESLAYLIESTYEISRFSFKYDRVNLIFFIVIRRRSYNNKSGPEIFMEKGASEYFQPFALALLFFFAERLRIWSALPCMCKILRGVGIKCRIGKHINASVRPNRYPLRTQFSRSIFYEAIQDPYRMTFSRKHRRDLGAFHCDITPSPSLSPPPLSSRSFSGSSCR